MGLLGKSKVKEDELIDNLVNVIINSSTSKESLEMYSKMLRKMNENPIINQEQQREILVLEMLALTRAVAKLGDKVGNSQRFLDKFHKKIYARVSGNKNEQIKFEKFVQARYQTYYQILASKEENMMMFFGKQFSDYFLRKDVKHQGLAMFVSVTQIFAVSIESFEKMLHDIFLKFEITQTNN